MSDTCSNAPVEPQPTASSKGSTRMHVERGAREPLTR